MSSESVSTTAGEQLKMISDQVAFQQWCMKFIEDQARQDRANFDRTFRRAVWFITTVIAVALAVGTFLAAH